MFNPIIKNSQASTQFTNSNLNITHKLEITSKSHSISQRGFSWKISQNEYIIKKMTIFSSLF